MCPVSCEDQNPDTCHIRATRLPQTKREAIANSVLEASVADKWLSGSGLLLRILVPPALVTNFRGPEAGVSFPFEALNFAAEWPKLNTENGRCRAFPHHRAEGVGTAKPKTDS